MAPNSLASYPVDPEANIGPGPKVPTPVKPDEDVKKSSSCDLVATLQVIVNYMALLFLGVTVGASVGFGLRQTPLDNTQQHVLLCVIGYQMMMTPAIMSLAGQHAWTAKLRLVDRRRIHWAMQLVGSALAIAGTFHKILNKTSHWTTTHGQVGLVALVFTSVSLVNGLASLYAYELRGVFSGGLSKISHVCFGSVAFAAATFCLHYGFDKNTFRVWAGDNFTSFVMITNFSFASIILTNPITTFYKKTKVIIKNRSL